MREDTRKRLDRLHIRDWLGWLPVLGVLIALAGGLIALHMSAGSPRAVQGTVATADWRLNEDTGQHYPHIEVKLDGGMEVRVGSFATTLPAVGTRIVVRQRGLLFDYLTTYEWDGTEAASVASPAAAPGPTPTPVSLP